MNLNKQNAIIVAIILLVATFLIVSHCNKPIDQPVLDYNALKFSKDSLQSVNNAITIDVADFKRIHLAKEDSLTRLLQAAVTGKTISAAVISTKTSIKDSGATIVSHDTVRVKGDSAAFNPIYTFNQVDSTQELHIVAGHDSTHVEVTLFNKQIIESKFVSSGILGLGKKSIVLQVENSNPHIRTTNQVSFVAPLPKPNRLLWLLGGAVIGTFTYSYLKK